MSEQLKSENPFQGFEKVAPAEPYNDFMIQFSVLQRLGYPVTIEEVSALDVAAALPGRVENPVFWYQLVNYPKWIKPVVLDPDFEKFIETSDDMGRLFVELKGHPASVTGHIQIGNCEYFLDKIKATSDSTDKAFFERCFVAVFERTSRIPPDMAWNPEDINPETTALYANLVEKGVPPVSPEELAQLFLDYYQRAEQLYPGFKKYKKAELASKKAGVS